MLIIFDTDRLAAACMYCLTKGVIALQLLVNIQRSSRDRLESAPSLTISAGAVLASGIACLFQGKWANATPLHLHVPFHIPLGPGGALLSQPL